MADRLIDTDHLIDHFRGARRLQADALDFYSVALLTRNTRHFARVANLDLASP